LLSANPAQDDKTLRLLWPQWQGAAEYMVAQLTPESRSNKLDADTRPAQRSPSHPPGPPWSHRYGPCHLG